MVEGAVHRLADAAAELRSGLRQNAFDSHPRQINAIPLWERACSRRRRDSQYFWRLTHRIREQARSHIGFVSS
ncbi:hypothetical protein C0J26_08835 [Pseudomonas baetica]|nr:hypothetical protein C0J26_08835 [Pseudomonas baetica]